MYTSVIVEADRKIAPCYQDLVTFTLGHSNYPDHTRVLIDAEDDKNFITLGYARIFVRSFVGALHSYGIGEGHTVCLHIYNHILFPLMFLAIVGTGARVTAANPAYTVHELQHHFRVSKTTFVITSNEHITRTREAAQGIENLKGDDIFWLTFPDRSDADILEGGHQPTLEALVGNIGYGKDRHWRAFDDRDKAQNTIACLNSTSGTTGLPKMAARSHHSLVMESLAIEDKVKKPYEVRRLLCTPFFHGFTLPLAVISALRLGLPTYVMRRFDLAKFLCTVERYSITETAMPPPMLVRFLAMAPADREPLKGLRLVWSGGASMGDKLQLRAVAMFASDARICQVWGMTEGGWMTTFAYPERDNTGSVGRLVATYEAKFVPLYNEEYTEKGMTSWQVGHVWVRSPINMLGYFDNPAATTETITKDGWMKTGDLAYFMPDKRICVVDRLKDLIKVRGWQVAPAEIEARLLEHPDIVDAAVIGIDKEEEASEIPRAYVVTRVKDCLTIGDVKLHLLDNLAKYKVSDCEVYFRDDIPKSASGKILKQNLRQEAADEHAIAHGLKLPYRPLPMSAAYGL